MAPVESLEVGGDPKATWRAPWYMVCGRCTPSDTDTISCCVAYSAPYVAYGYTTSRAFRTSFWREVGKFLLFFAVVGTISFGLSIAHFATCSSPTDTTKFVDGAPPAPGKACVVLSMILVFLKCGSFVCAIAWAVFVGGPRRTQLRRLLGISGSGAGGDCCTCCYNGVNKGQRSDCCLHFWCLWCALAQEMRTVMHLQAANKLPEGPPEGYEPLITTAPSVDGGMFRATGVPVAGKGDMLV